MEVAESGSLRLPGGDGDGFLGWELPLSLVCHHLSSVLAPHRLPPLQHPALPLALWYPWISPGLGVSVSSEACPVPCFFLVR